MYNNPNFDIFTINEIQNLIKFYQFDYKILSWN